MLTKNPLSVAVATVISSLVGVQAFAQSATEEVVVTGIKGSLQRAMDVKRDATGVVDAISAEDIGKMPDSNLAESLQRITGVSINRVNGEGSEVTVRGFGGNFNLVTVNGRSLPSANVNSITGNPVDQANTGVSRSFDFSNLASEGVSGIQVYKTGRASVASGGVGATININTIKPLEAGGTKASVGVKAVEDTSGDGTTPEVSGLYSWANDEGTFGVAIFGSYQERDYGSRTMAIENWTPGVWADPAPYPNNASANIINAPEIGQTFVKAENIGYSVNEVVRERTNGQLTLQFAPNDEMTITADALYAENVQDAAAVIDGIWNQGSHSTVEFDGNTVVPTVVKQTEPREPVGAGAAADFFFQNLEMGVEDTVESFGVNFDWQMRDDLNLNFDIATAEAESGPGGPFGKNSVRANVAGGVAGWRSWDYTGALPQVSVAIDDWRTSDPSGANGVFDLPDVGTQVLEEYFSSQLTETDQFSFTGTWDWKEDVTVAFGASYVGTDMTSKFTKGREELGGWGINNPGDVPEGLLTQGCTGCEFEDFDLSQNTPGAADVPAGAGTVIPLGSVSFRGDASDIIEAMNGVSGTNFLGDDYAYSFTPGAMNLIEQTDNLVEEEIWAGFVQMDLDGQLAGMDTHVTVGLRYEETETTSTSFQSIPLQVNWISDNDFESVLSTEVQGVTGESSYNNFLPSIDVSINFTDDVVGRASFSQTIARPTYDKLYSATTFQIPSSPTALGGVPGGQSGNVNLDPLESNNVDLSVEWYYGDANMLSLGYYRKDVSNFVGTEIVQQPLFGLRDPSSDVLGSRSGDALQALLDNNIEVSEGALYQMTVILDTGGVPADFDPNAIVFATVEPDANDPLYSFGVQQPLNTETATIYGWEFASQHFFGETGFGYQFNFTTVEGDIEYDVGADPADSQFALEGLSDSANFVAIYEKHGISARVLYNWRDTFLNQAQRVTSGGNRMPEFVDEYEQWDLNVSYEINDNFSVSFDAINLTEEENVIFGRSLNQPFSITEGDARYMLGLRYTM